MLDDSRWVICTWINSLHELLFPRTSACVDIMEEWHEKTDAEPDQTHFCWQ